MICLEGPAGVSPRRRLRRQRGEAVREALARDLAEVLVAQPSIAVEEQRDGDAQSAEVPRHLSGGVQQHVPQRQALRRDAPGDALMRLPGRLDEARVRDAARQAVADMTALERDLEARGAEIEAALGEATAQARLLRLQGTPAFVIGNCLVPGALDLTTMRRVVAEVRGAG